MDYGKLSDAEINWKVAFHIGLRTVEKAESGDFNPCNNPADAWPIINDNQIALIPSHMSFGWIALSDLTLSGNASYVDERLDNCIKHEDWNGLRAAMIVFLMMQDSANVQDNPA